METSASRKTLGKTDLLGHLDAETLKPIETRCEWVDYPADSEIVWREGDNPHDVYFVIDGGVRVIRKSQQGEDVALANLGPGASFGELSAIDALERSASVHVTIPSLIAIMPREVFLEIVDTAPGVGVKLLRRFAGIIRAADDRIETVSTLTPIQRIYRQLLEMAEPDASGIDRWVIEPVPLHKEIAIWASTSQTEVAKAIGQLMKVGLARRRNTSLQILDRERMESLAKMG